MEHLLDQAIQHQQAQCVFLNSDNVPSLFHDATANPSQLPTELVQTLEAHSDEVWFCTFSPDGRYLASGSKVGLWGCIQALSADVKCFTCAKA